MKEIRLAYSDLYNAGDLMNVDIVEKLGNCRVKRSKTYCADMTAIGGALIGLQYSDNALKKICQYMLGKVYAKRPIYIWGSGFLHDYSRNGFYRENIHVCALRGRKSQEKLKDITGKFYDVPLADAGLLVDVLMQEMPEKKYKIGLIPHMWHQEEENVIKMSRMEGVHLIDIKQTPQKTAYEIAMCETVVSTSLHGLIFADSLHIPNMHITVEKELRGGNFKYEDYYSAFGLKDELCILEKHIPEYEEIIEKYRIDVNEVEKKKKELTECFPNI